MNQCILIGKVGTDSEVKPVGQTQLVSFRLATSRKYKDDWKTDWHDVTIWGKDATQVNKGDTVMVSGQYITESWEDKEGNKKQKQVFQGFTMINKPKQAADPVMQAAAEVFTGDNIPF